jgi:hypothetical protein
VRNLSPNLWILGGKPVHNTTCWGEQTGKIAISLIRRRFVPALTGTLTAKPANTAGMVNFIRKSQQFHNLGLASPTSGDASPAKVNGGKRPTSALHESGQFSDSACGETHRQKIHI